VGVISVTAERKVGAPAPTVYGYIADYREHHPKFLPPAFSDWEVESGGVGTGTIVRFALTAGGRTRQNRQQIAEPEPGRVLTESDTGSSSVTTFTVTPDGDSCTVQLNSRWNGASGIGGFFERLFAPPTLRRIMTDELARLDAYAREQAAL
jgi:hypothetical protein